MNKEKSKNRGLMTEGVIWKEILLFSIPLLLGNLFQQLYNAVDSVVVGNYIGAQALAAVGSSAPVINLLVSFFMGLAVGAGVIISRYFGARKKEELHIAVHTSLALTFAAGLVMTLIGVLISPYVLQWVGTPSDVMESSVLYLRIYFLGILSVMVYNMGSGILRAVGDRVFRHQHYSGYAVRHRLSHGNCRSRMGHADCTDHQCCINHASAYAYQRRIPGKAEAYPLSQAYAL